MHPKAHPVIKKERFRPLGGGRRLSYSQETDGRLLQWVKEFQASGINVTRDMLQKQALAMIQVECPDFKASSGWVEKFLVRHGISLPGSCRHVGKRLTVGFSLFMDQSATTPQCENYIEAIGGKHQSKNNAPI